MSGRYGLVLGQGRSGTNWIMDCLDASPVTFCRNEPDECTPSFLDPLVNDWRIGADGAALGQWWDALAGETMLHMGERDQRIDNPKTFVHPISQRLGIAQLSARPKVRKLASRLIWSWADGEWKMPRWVGNLNNAEIFPVLKLVQSYNWATWLLENRPDVPVIQVVRHPGARHESLLRRDIGSADSEPTRRARIEQLRLLAPEKGLAERIGPVDSLSLAQAETWFGVYQMEAFEARAQGSPNYLRIVFEDMVASPEQAASQIFNHFELPLTRGVLALLEQKHERAAAEGASNHLDGWRDRLDAATCAEIDDILATSPIASWWSNGEVEPQMAA